MARSVDQGETACEAAPKGLSRPPRAAVTAREGPSRASPGTGLSFMNVTGLCLRLSSHLSPSLNPRLCQLGDRCRPRCVMHGHTLTSG